MNKKLFTSLLAAGMLAAFGAANVSAADVTLVMAEENDISSLSGKVAQYFAEQVEELTEGSVAIDLQCSKVLGSETDILKGMIMGGGTVDIERVTSSRLTSYGCPKAASLGLPYLFANREQFWALADSDLKDEIFEEISRNNITGLSFYEEGFRNFFFKEPVEDIAGIAGNKIRVADDPIMSGFVSALGASPTSIPSSDIYTSLQSGVIDGAEQPLSPYQKNAFNEVAPYMILDEHTLGNAIYIISNDSLMKLNDDQIAAIKQAAINTQEYNKQMSVETDEQVMAELTEAGVTFVEVADKTPYIEAVKTVTEENTKGIEDFYAALVALGE